MVIAVVISAWLWLLGQCCSVVAINTSSEEKEKKRLTCSSSNEHARALMQAVMAINTAKSKEKKEKRKKEKLAGLVNMQRDGDRW